jgi:dephospho-CoA kinase
MIIFGITGTLGAGKGTVVDYLVKEKEFVHYSVRQFLIDRLESEKKEVNRDTMVALANALREKHGADYIARALYEKAAENNTNCIIESLRTVGEINALREKEDFYLLAVDADAKLRYQRINLRKSETDNISFEEFVANEKREMQNDDPNKQNLKNCIEMADYQIDNNGSVNALHQKVEEIISDILK